MVSSVAPHAGELVRELADDVSGEMVALAAGIAAAAGTAGPSRAPGQPA